MSESQPTTLDSGQGDGLFCGLQKMLAEKSPCVEKKKMILYWRVLHNTAELS